MAVQQIAEFPHSIGQLVFHMNYWMSYELRRIRRDRSVYPDHAAKSWPAVGRPGDTEQRDRQKRDLAWLLAEHAELAKSSAPEMQREIDSAHEGDKREL